MRSPAFRQPPWSFVFAAGQPGALWLPAKNPAMNGASHLSARTKRGGTTPFATAQLLSVFLIGICWFVRIWSRRT